MILFHLVQKKLTVVQPTCSSNSYRFLSRKKLWNTCVGTTKKTTLTWNIRSSRQHSSTKPIQLIQVAISVMPWYAMTQWGNDTLYLSPYIWPTRHATTRRHPCLWERDHARSCSGFTGAGWQHSLEFTWFFPRLQTRQLILAVTKMNAPWIWVLWSVIEKMCVCVDVQIWCFLWLCEEFSSNWPCMRVILLQSQAATKFLLMDKSSGLKRHLGWGMVQTLKFMEYVLYQWDSWWKKCGTA